jgi:hypothetical protein
VPRCKWSSPQIPTALKAPRAPLLRLSRCPAHPPAQGFDPPEAAPGRARHQERDPCPDLLAAGEVHPRLVPRQAGHPSPRRGFRHLPGHRLPVQGRRNRGSRRAGPALHEALGKAADQELPYVILDGTRISSDRCSDKKASRKGAEIDKWYFGKAHEHAGLVQGIIAPFGIPLWTSDSLPGSTHDITSARELVLPGPRPWLKPFPCLADSAYEAAGAGILVPVKKPRKSELDEDTKTCNRLLRSLRCQGERGFALLKERWRALQHVTVDPGSIGDIVKAALVLT